jgi:DNA (cytosine-5)-methyltransferase 1
MTQVSSLEIFSGAGGLALGMAQSGIHHEALVEWNREASETLRTNFDPHIVYDMDVSNFIFSDYGHVDIIAGGPPCQPFSLGGKHKGEMDKRDMFPHACRAISECTPSAFVFENVKGLLRKSFSSYFGYIILRLTYPDIPIDEGEKWESHLARLERVHTSQDYRGIKYNVIFRLIDAADYGVPQRRERVVIVGIRDDLGVQWSFPEATHSMEALLWSQFVTGEYWARHKVSPPSSLDCFDKRTLAVIQRMKKQASLFPPAKQPWVTIRDALADTPMPDKEGSYHAEHILREGARPYPGHTGSFIDFPAKTIKAGGHGVPGGENMLRHADGTVRYFTTYEAKLLQTFPSNYRITGSWTESMRQVGNAVPVRLAHVISQALLGQIWNKKVA